MFDFYHNGFKTVNFFHFFCAKNECVEMFAIQVKEKYGTLRFYMSCETDEISALIEEAEAFSTRTCEVCGNPGILRGEKWFLVRCDKCYEEKK